MKEKRRSEKKRTEKKFFSFFSRIFCWLFSKKKKEKEREKERKEKKKEEEGKEMAQPNKRGK